MEVLDYEANPVRNYLISDLFYEKRFNILNMIL